MFLGIPCLWVNSEKYCFSKEVLENGQKLFEMFCNLLNVLRYSYNQYDNFNLFLFKQINRIKSDDFNENFQKTKKELKNTLLSFDEIWVQYEEVSKNNDLFFKIIRNIFPN